MTNYIETAKDYLVGWPGIVALVLVAYYGLRAYQQYTFQKANDCKSVENLKSPYFAIPMLLELLQKKSSGQIVDWSHEKIEESNDTFGINLAGNNIIFTRDPENIKAVLGTQFTDFALGSRHAHFLPLLGDGIFTLDGEGWKHSRAMLRPQFARDQVAHVQALEPHLQLVARHIKKAQGNTFDLQEIFFKLTVDTATEFLFGESVASLEDESIGIKSSLDFAGRATFAQSFNLAQTYLASRSWSQQFYPLINPREFKDACANIHTFAKHYVNKALELTSDDLEKKSESGYVFLYELAKQTRNPTVLQDQLLNILVAGRDTTAGLLSFTFYELARNPDIFAKLKDEIYTTFGKEGIEKITFESLKKCEYLKWVVNEVLRLYPSVPMNYRYATKETTLPIGGGKDGLSKAYVRKGTVIAYDIFSTHRMKKHYGEDALEFRPSRWGENNRYGWAYLPFNGGPRICLGQQFALTEASYIITRLVQLFPNLEARDTYPYPPPKNNQLTMCLQHGLAVSMTQ